MTMIGSPSRIGRVRGKRKLSLEAGEGADDQHGTGNRVVVLGHSLLERVSEDDQQEQVERLKAAEFALADDPRQYEQKHEHGDGAEDEIHDYG
jgi:hypothetical protein